MKKILLIDGHPNAGSFSSHLAGVYEKAAKKVGHKVRRITVRELKFKAAANVEYRKALPKDLQKAQQDILWAEQLVFVFPTWWFGMPALLKGFLDHTFASGFAFKYTGHNRWLKLLKGRQAHIIVTTGTNALLERIIYWPLQGALRSMLKFCGVAPVKLSVMGEVSPRMTPKEIARHEKAVANLVH